MISEEYETEASNSSRFESNSMRFECCDRVSTSVVSNEGVSEFEEIVDGKFENNTFYKLLVTILLVFLFFGVGCGMGAIPCLLSEMYEYLSDFQEIEKKNVRLFVLLTRGIGLVVFSLLIGRVYEFAKSSTKWYHLNVHHVMGFGSVFLFCLFLSLVPVIYIAPITLTMNMFWGMGMSTVMVGGTILPKAIWISPGKTAATSQSMYSALSLGATVYSLIIGKTVKKYEEWSPRLKIFVVYYFIIGIFLVPSFLGFLPPPKFDEKEKKNGNGESGKNSSFFSLDLEKAKEIWKNDSWWGSKVGKYISHKRSQIDFVRAFFILSLSLCLFCHSSVIKCVSNMVTSYAEDLGWSRSKSTYLATVFYTTFTVSRIMSIFLFLATSNSVILLSFYVGSTTLVLVGLSFLRHNEAALWIGIGMIGFAISPCFVGLTLLPQKFSLKLSGSEMGFMLTPNGFSASSAGVLGWLMVSVHNEMFFSVNLFFSICSVLLYLITLCLGVVLRRRNCSTSVNKSLDSM